MTIPEELGQSAQLNSYHRDINPSVCAGFGVFVIANQATLAHQPTEGPLYDPTPRQKFETARVIAAFDHFHHHQLRPQATNQGCQVRATIAAIHAKEPELGQPAQSPSQQGPNSFAFGHVGRGDDCSQDQAQSIDQQISFASFDPFDRIRTHRAAVPVGFDGLTVQNRSAGPRAFPAGLADISTQPRIERRPCLVQSPAAEDMITRLPRRKGGGEQSP
jgi:hypothetical protein